MTTIGIILVTIAIISVAFIYYAIKTAERHDEEIDKVQQPKFQPRKVTIVVSDETEKPKRKKKRYYNKKKKPAVAENAPVEKRPVGRPKKSN